MILTGCSPLRAIAIIVGGVALVGVMSLGALAAWTLLGTRARRRTVETVPPTGVGLVLGAETYEDRTPAPSLRARLDLAVRLYRAGKVRALIASGDEGSHDQVSVMARYLVDHGVPEADVILDPLGVDTYASCARAQGEYGLQQVTMISQDYHLPRTLTICRLIGLDAYGVGDTSVRRAAPKAWRRSVRREIAANVKMVGDLLGHRLGVRPVPSATPEQG
ncbi:protein SanA, affects membrane permeability for vancomycin [Raineyella antarctica]|uniref:Protein SanA, affects membrane permeability for vancomycin n=1 Tax=Raineyella antarctica TaxID=1577474 RepID=A0A1G6GF71_9ACTN|nr:ElyC/SanA/YdcF family protein [Raineyella antarctica]SDB80662.1 protein SanA, affects membrane permeability for vancomycin [Raineyella antarctica]